jgi:hypothetical protein
MEANRNDTVLAGLPHAGVLASAQAPALAAEQQRPERRRLLLVRTISATLRGPSRGRRERVSLIAQPECAVGGERFCSDAEQHCDGRLPMMPQVLGWDSAVRFGRDSRIHATERKRRREERRLLRLVPAPVPAARPLGQVVRLDR